MAGFAEPIAIIGSGCRFPGGSSSPSSLWKLLYKPRDVLEEIRKDRFDLTGYYHSDGAHHGTTNVRHSYMLDDDIRLFDAQFFNIKPTEADSMDPQQRLLMETVYESIESAGLTIEGLRGSDTAVYVGVMAVDYQDILMRDVNGLPVYFATGISRSIISNRISYFFDWRGPCMTIDTACSSSMVAVHQGIQALRSGESRIAIAAGAELILGPENYVAESKMNLLSPTGRSRMWDADADGYARGDGIAVIVMKKLSDALEDGDIIESIIRETGVNQDGRTSGLTVPSSEAQASLIRRTYAKAGLDITNPQDRPQFFEAHGTGTKVGDPREAAAIKDAFFGASTTDVPLYVGSIKTVIGHTEGTAGLAGLLKGSLALQHGIIPPNMLFSRLNPSIEPYYDCLLVPTNARSWPTMPEGCPRRISVNSFGFGGTNAHAILENHQTTKDTVDASEPNMAPFTPFTFSAGSERSLIATLHAYSDFLRGQDSLNLRDLAWTLQSHRSEFPIKACFSGTSVDRLVTKIEAKLAEAKSNAGNPVGVRSNAGEARLLGIFTGQGAQWATMGKQLVLSSTFVRERVKHLADSLADLPDSDRPGWNLEQEILADTSSSRISESEMSQPLCTTIQIVLVDLLQAAGITFTAVVGHSSGEIAAAYAAGFISAYDAIRIAYYRGLYAKLAGGFEGEKGSMLAVGTSWDDAKDLCELPAFEGRLCVAAVNSSASITLSGDMDAIAQAKKVFEEEKKFARLLKVDIAYHSHHMLPCSDHYIDSLRACKIQVNYTRGGSCSWYSSVHAGQSMEPNKELEDTYWRDNMVKPVLFTAAVTSAAKTDVNLGLEVGPHPALKGPAIQTISDVREASLPYCGVLSRNNNDIEAFSDSLGYIWTQFGRTAVDFASVDKLMSKRSTARFLKGLPSYQWDHSRIHWYEPRISKNTRARSEPFHELLGTRSPDGTEGELRWSNLLKPAEIPWLNGHQLQGQTVFPAAGYVAMALEAAKKLVNGTEVRLFEVHELKIGRAITFEDDPNSAVETLITLTGVTASQGGQETREADFSCYSSSNAESTNMSLMASGRVKVILGKSSTMALSLSPPEALDMTTIDTDRFYTSLLDLGYGYTGSFKGMSSLKRKLDKASAFVSTYCYESPDDSMMVHPTMLDVAFQACLLAQSTPGDQRLWSLHIPTSIRCIRVNPCLCDSLPILGTRLPIHAELRETESISICGDIDICAEGSIHTLIQVEALTLVPFSPAVIGDDRKLFSSTQWDTSTPNGDAIIGNDRASVEELELASLCERLAFYYLRKWKAEITEAEWADSEWHHQRLQDSMDQLLSVIASGRHPYVRKDWASDTYEDIMGLISKYPNSIDLRLISAVGENIPASIRRKTTILEHMMKDNMLDELYKEGIGFARYNTYLAKMVKQIAHHYPRMKILEIGAGTGGATKSVLDTLADNFSSYTYTDISTGFFEKASELFKNYGHKMIFKALDVERSPASQGYQEYSYDLIIASNVLHATKSLHQTLERTRRLLKPGGYLLLLEITNNGPIRIGSMTGGLSGWWIGVDDGRRHAPTVSPATWNAALRKTGFSGVDAITPERDVLAWPFSILAAQAVDERINFLRRPLSYLTLSPPIEELIILGNQSIETSRIAGDVADLLRKYCGKISILDGLPTDTDPITSMSTFLNLADLDGPIFKDLTIETMAGLKRLFALSKEVLWITHNCRTDEPYHMASVGFGRAISHELPYMRLQFLDLETFDETIPRVIADCILRMHATEEWEQEEDPRAKLLWSKEPEIMLQKGQILIPRVVAHRGQNARLNSLRRSVTDEVAPQRSTIHISHSDGMFALQDDPYKVSSRDGLNSVKISHSVLSALNICTGTFLYLGIGAAMDSGDTVVCLSETNASFLVPRASFKCSKISLNQYPNLVSAVAGELLARFLATEIPRDSIVLVHEPEQALASALNRQAAAKGIHLTYSTTAESADPTWITLHPRASARVIKRSIPRGLTYFLNFAADANSKELISRIATNLAPACQRVDASALFRHQSSIQDSDDSILSTLLSDAVAHAMQNARHDSPSMVSLGLVPDRTISKLPTAIVDWTVDNLVNIQVQPLSANSLFSKHKTYLLVGLTGQIGRSICEWMARNGAGYICITSRNPSIDADWLGSLRNIGTYVKVFAMDITNKQDLQRVYDKIQTTLPPIAGVANAAMVLQDTLFSEMSHEMMEKVLKPKIDGTNNLNEVFYDTDLDFFVLFSSLSSVVGNTGQSNYAAASTYLTAVATQRRKRGLAASSFDIGRVVGIGYVERAGQVVQDQLVKYGYMPISESDFHHMFAETIRAGRPELNENPVITTGIRAVRDDEEVKVPWFDNPRFSHFILEANETASRMASKRAVLSVNDQLKYVTTMTEAFECLKQCFATKLQLILQLSTEQLNDDVPLVELGVDSLVAVEVRSWFLKELKIDMPVLKVLGGGTVANLCRQALDKLPEKLVPNIGASEPLKTTAPITPSQPQGSAPTVVDSSSASSSPESSSSISSYTPSLAGSVTPVEEVSTKASESKKEDLSVQNAILKTEKISFAQSRFWFLRLLMEDQTTFNVTFYYRVTGKLRVNDLERAIKVVGRRHEGLRTCFLADENEADLAYQGVLESSHLQLEHRKVNSVEEVAAEYQTLKGHLFDLEHGKLMRVILLSLSQTSHYLLFSYHHILMDGVSYQIFLSDLEKAYKGQSLGPQPRQFPAFSKAQLNSFENGDMDNELKYWRELFPDGPPVLPLLPIAQISTRKPMKTFGVYQVAHRLDARFAKRIKQMSTQNRSTTFHFHLATFKAMLFRFLRTTEDLTIGIADANRNDDDVMGTIGLFLNLLTLRFQYQPSQSFADAMIEARNKAYGALTNSRLPFDILLKELKIPRSSFHSPLFQAFFDYRQGAQEKQTFGNCELEIQEVHPGRTAYDVTLDVTDSSSGTLIMLRTQKGLYGTAETELLMKTYVNLLTVFSSDTSSSLKDVPLFSEEQMSQGLKVGRGPNLQSDWPNTLPHRIDQIVEKRKDNIAVEDGAGRKLTYNQMMARIEAIAEALQTKSIGEGSRVAVFQQASSDWVCSLLAIMRIGALYVPLDLRNPLPRLAAIVASCRPKAILTDDKMTVDVKELNMPSAQIMDVSTISAMPSTPVPNLADPDSPAAILYTSGSTGTPKGIIIKHSGLRNEMEGYTKTWKLGAERVLQQSAFTFNHSTDQIFTGLVNGGSVYVVPWSKRGDPLEITKLIINEKITYTKATPSEYLQWLQYGSSNLKQASHWRNAFGGGEMLSSTLTSEFASLNLPQLHLFNSYGPAEITISSTKMEVMYCEDLSNERIPCGYSLPNYVTYILDDHLNPVPAGVPGEIVLGGAGVSLGYLHNRELTDRHFIPDPFATPEYLAQGWTKMYRTGDIGRLRSDGALIFESRIAGDTQIKIRGIRVELDDIESNIVRSSQGVLREAVVTLRGMDPEFLVAHVVFAAPHAVTDKEEFLRQLLAHLPLPQYMIPVMAIPLDRLPLSNHSKVDRKAIKELALPQRQETSTNLTETMAQLKRLWEDVLCNKELGFDVTSSTSFFQVGGNSLLIVRLQSRIREAFNIVVRLVELLEANTLGDMAQRIEESLAVEAIDWDAETTLPDLGSNGVVLSSPPAQGHTKVVLLTGSTGFLAKYILEQLAASPYIARIHCVAIRRKPTETDRASPAPSGKIVTHAGDLSQPWLGLPEAEYWALSSHVDMILHLGAVRSFWDSYHILRPTNVSSTKELIKIAAPRRIPMIYTSSAGVVPPDFSIRTAQSVAMHPPPTDGSNGYVASRWASERLLERAASTLDIPVSIHRFTPGEASSRTVVTSVLEDFVRFAHQLRLMPELNGWEGHFDMLPAKEAARLLCEVVLDYGLKGVSFFHHGCNISMDVSEMRDFMEDKVGEAGYERMPGLKWVGKIKRLGFGYFFASQDVTVKRMTRGTTETLDSRR